MQNLKNRLNLIYELSRLDFKLKYYGSGLGLFWSFVKPFLMFGILYLVFFSFLKVGIMNYEVYLFLGIIFWNFFADTTKDIAPGIAAKAHLLQGTNLPLATVVLGTVLHSFWTLLITLGIFFVFFFALGLKLTASAALLVVLIPILAALAAGVAFLLAPLFIRFKDFGHMWDVFLQLLFWVTPIVYDYKLVPAALTKWYLLNPLTRLLVDARNVTLYGFVPELKQILITVALVGIVAGAATLVFRRYGRTFIEQL